MAFDFDFVVIGGGSGGVRAARVSADHGAKVAVVEERFWGGTCVNVGCVPKKLMVYAAHVPEELRVARALGWSVPVPALDWSTLVQVRDREVARLAGVYRRLLEGRQVRCIDGRATLLDAHRVQVRHPDGTCSELSAARILIATGGTSVRPTSVDARLTATSDDVFTLSERPQRIVIVGGGYIAVEFASIFHGLGSEVHLVYRGPHLLRGFDDDVRAFFCVQMRASGIQLHLNAEVDTLCGAPGQLVCTLQDGSVLEANVALFAIGRRPNIAGLGLERAGVQTSPAGAITVDDWSQTNVPSIYAVGDVTDRMALTPVALAEGHAVADTLFGDRPRQVSHAAVPTAVFATPQVATVGLTEAQACEQYGQVTVYTSEFRPLRHTVADSPVRTFCKVIVAKDSERLLGVHLVGEDAAEMLQGFAVAVRAGLRKSDLDACIGIHPTSAEELVTLRTPRPD